MKLVIYSTVTDILPFFHAEFGNTRFKLGCWKFHDSNRQVKSSFSCSVGSLVASNVHVTGDPAEFNYFASLLEACVVFDNFKYQIQFNFEAIEGFQA